MAAPQRQRPRVEHLTTVLVAHNFAKRLKTLQALTPYEYVCQQWQQHPDRLQKLLSEQVARIT
jgi:hypothetical protein